jgi:hypothetical protein
MCSHGDLGGPFEPEPQLQTMAENYSRRLIDYARERYGITLDWSDENIRQVERICDVIHADYKAIRPSEEEIQPTYIMLGSYVGEALRRNHGADWGWVTLEGKRAPGMQRGSTLVWPWIKARKRIIDGPGENLWIYYQYLINPEATEFKQ